MTKRSGGSETIATPTVSWRYVQKLLDAAKGCGLDPYELWAAIGVGSLPPHDPDSRLSTDVYLRLFAIAMERVRDPAFPLRVAAVSDYTSLDVLGFVTVTSATFGDALLRLERYLPLMTDGARWELTQSGAEARMALIRVVPFRYEHQFVDEWVLPEMVMSGRTFTAVDWNPLEVRYRHPEPPDYAAQRAVLRAPIRFDCERSEIRFSADILDLPLIKADPAIAAYFDRQIQELLERVHADRPFVRSMKEALIKGLSTGETSLERAAKELVVSPRTLRRRLQEENVQFRQVLDEVRFELARRYLAERKLTIGEVALVLGYSAPAPFHRAFRRWAGRTPEEYRRSEA